MRKYSLPSRRRHLADAGVRAATLVSLILSGGCSSGPAATKLTLVNDAYAQLNLTVVDRIIQPRSLAEVRNAIQTARQDRRSISISGGRQALGGQQFGTDDILLDMSAMKRVLQFDPEKGRVDVEAGIRWPELIQFLANAQKSRTRPWGIIQKPAGTDLATLGGSLAANSHGQGLAQPPLIADVESFILVDADGLPRRCSRFENAELFRLAIGGYGLFGVITSVQLNLAPRVQLEARAEVVDADQLMPRWDQEIKDGCSYGEFHLNTDTGSDAFLRRGVLSCYRPVAAAAPRPPASESAGDRPDPETLYLAHTDPGRAFDLSTARWLAASGQRRWSDELQLTGGPADYHTALDKRLKADVPGSEWITELIVPQGNLDRLLNALARDFRDHPARVIDGVVRLARKDDESFLAWAREDCACVALQIHVDHQPEGLEQARTDARRMIDRALELEGGFSLAYHRWATREQLETGYPRFPEFLKLKKQYDPQQVFQSSWYRYLESLLADEL